MLYGGGLLSLILLVIWAWAVFDVIASEEVLIRNLPKIYWLLIVLLVPTIGAVAWFALGRPIGAGLRPGSGTADSGSLPSPRPAPKAPDDSQTFLDSIADKERLQRWEEDLKRREEDLKRREDDEEPPNS